MALTELLPTIEALPRVEKLQLLQYLISIINKEEGISPLDAEATYPVWTPYDIPNETVTKMAQMLKEANDIPEVISNRDVN
jgi:hypothetical protein